MTGQTKIIALAAAFALLAACYEQHHGTSDVPPDEGAPDADVPEGSEPCTGGTFIREEIETQPFTAVDILVVVDNSGSMAAEQAMLRDAFPNLIRRILTGTDDAGNPVHEPVRDLHIGVVSTDMGVGGYSVTTCEGNPMSGDDGILQHTPHGTGCAASYPSFLSYVIDSTADPDLAQVEQVASDFGCIAVLGTNGCGFEQQLQAAYQALVTHSVPGGANAGFLRGNSILAVLFVSDEEDCSAEDTTLFDVSSYPYGLNLGCYYQATKLYPVEHYISAFRDLKDNPDNLVFGFIVGVPPGERACNGRGSEIGNCLDHPAMQETVRADGELLEYVCKYPPDCQPPDPPNVGNCISEAYPGRRYIQLAQELGDSAVVQSICTDSFIPAVSALTEKLREVITSRTFNRPIGMDKDPADACRCLAPCTVIETLSNMDLCPDYDGDGRPNIRDADGDTIGDVEVDAAGLQHSQCEIPQAGSILSDCSLGCDDPLAVMAKDPTTPGWWYDHSHDTNGDTVRDYTMHFEGVEARGGSTTVIECCF
jgi:hypothetical protein